MHALCDYSQVGLLQLYYHVSMWNRSVVSLSLTKKRLQLIFFYPFSVVTCEPCSRTAHVYI